MEAAVRRAIKPAPLPDADTGATVAADAGPTLIFHGGNCASVMIGDCVESMRQLPDASVQCCVTSPPYFGLRDYGQAGQMGLEATPDTFVAGMVGVFREVRRVLRDDGTLWLNLGDSYASSGKDGNPPDSPHQTQKMNAGSYGVQHRKTPAFDGIKAKDLIGIPWRVAFALQADGWYLRQDIIWHKPNPMPESVTDRCTKAHEYIFMLTKSARYYFDSVANQVPASSSYANDKRHGATALSHVPQKDYAGQGVKVQTPTQLHDNMFVKGKSGNKDRKQRPGADVLDIGTQAGSAPWEGMTANRRSVWAVTAKPFKGAHFATFPPDLIEPCVLAGSRPNDTILDPFGGSGTVAGVALKHGRNAILCELNPEYVALMPARVEQICNRP